MKENTSDINLTTMQILSICTSGMMDMCMCYILKFQENKIL